jgi:type I restriction enzyme S subunit
MPQNWKTYKLSDVATVQTGPFGSQLHKKDYVKVGTPIITVEHLGENRITYQNLPRIKNEDKNRLSKYHLKEGDVVFSRVGSVDRRALVTKSEDGWLFSGRCLRVRAKDSLASGSFLSYYFGKESFKDYIRRIAVGATMPSINTSILSNIEIKLPPLSEQRAIASILSAIDDKIELNLQMNKTLEDMAMALYKHVFVYFGPFQTGEFVDSKLGRIPKGWEVKRLEDILEIKYGKDHKKLTAGNIPVYGSGGIMRYVDQFLYDQDSILIPRKGTLSNLFYLTTPFWSVDTMFYSKIKIKHFGKYVFYFLKSIDLASMDVGSAVPSLTTELLKRIEILAPPILEIVKFDETVTRYFKTMESNSIENKTLTKLRDTLLPKLISGEVRVKDIEQTVAQVL